MYILGIIPARYASTRFPGKPLAEIAGKPMVQWVYERSIKAFKHVYVATDDTRISECVSGFGGECIITSPHHKSGTDRCAEALTIASNETGIQFDVVVNIQGDEPFIDAEQLEAVVKPFGNQEVQISTLAKLFAPGEDVFNSNSPKVVVSSTGKALYFSRSVIPFIRGVEKNDWQFKHSYYKHIGLYAYRSNVLQSITELKQSPLELAESLEQLRWLENGYNIHVGVTSMESLAVDTPDDLERVREYARKFLKG